VVATLGREQDPGRGGVQVDEQRDVVLPTLGGGLVHADPGDPAYVEPGPCLGDVVVQQPPQPGVVLTDQLGDGLDRHLGQQRHKQRLKQQREATARPRPRQRHLAGPMRLAGHPRHTGVQVGLMLEEVQVPPGLGLAVMDRASRLVTLWARKASALTKVQVQFQAAGRGVELGAHDLPGLGKAKSSLEQVIDFRHQGSSSVGLEDEPYRLTETLPTRFSEEPQNLTLLASASRLRQPEIAKVES
jgi:hypothetical protein